MAEFDEEVQPIQETTSDNTNNQLTIIDRSINVFKRGSAIIISHQERATLAVKVGMKIIAEWEAANAITDPVKKEAALEALDIRANKYLVNCGVALTEMKDERKAITQLMDTIKEMYTSEENKIDPKYSAHIKKVQDYRNNFAKWKIAERERKAKEAEVKASKAREATELKATFKLAIASDLLSLIARKKVSITTAFNNITLETYAEKSEALKIMSCYFDAEKLKFKIAATDTFPQGTQVIVLTTPGYLYHESKEVEEIKKSVVAEYDLKQFFADYQKEISALKQELIDKLPSKKTELDEAEAKRLQAIKDEEERQKKIAAAKSEEAKKKAEADAAAARLKEQQDREKAEEEKKQREAADKKRLDDEAEQKRKEAEQLIELQKSGEHAETLYVQAEETSTANAVPAGKSKFVIKVLHPGAWVLMFQMWFEEEGVKVKPEDAAALGSKKLDNIKLFCEKQAKKGKMIDSKYIVYEDEFRVTNQKEKKE